MKKRLDVLLVERGLAESRAQAQALVLAGLVPGLRQAGPAGRRGRRARRRAAAAVRLARRREARARARRARRRPGRPRLPRRRRVDRRLHRRPAATRRGARDRRVDVGYGQLHPRLRADARVTVLERTNARTLTGAPVRAAARRLRRLVHLGPPRAPARRCVSARRAGRRSCSSSRSSRRAAPTWGREASFATPTCGAASSARSRRRRSSWGASVAAS